MADRGDGQEGDGNRAALYSEIRRELQEMRESFDGLVKRSHLAWAVGLGIPILLGFMYWIVDTKTEAVSARVDDAALALNTRIDDSNGTLDARLSDLDSRLDDQSRMIAVRVVSDLETSGQLAESITEALDESAIATEFEAMEQSFSNLADQIEQVQRQLSLGSRESTEPESGFRDEENEEEGALAPLRLSDGAKPRITVEQRPPEIIITMPRSDVDVADASPQVEVRQSEPTVTYHEGDPEVMVERGEPHVEVTQVGEPTVTFLEQGEGTQQAAGAGQQQMAQGGEQDVQPAEEEDVTMVETEQMAESRPMVEREGFAMIEADQIDVTTLEGTIVYGVNDEDIGQISGLILSSDGGVQDVIVDVGGFLGLGAKPVAVDFGSLAVLREQGGDDLRLYLDATKEELENMVPFAE